MAEAAAAWLASLDPEQRAAAQWAAPGQDPEAEAERQRWFYTPTDHGGLPLGAQRPAQQSRAMRLVASVLSTDPDQRGMPAPWGVLPERSKPSPEPRAPGCR